MKQNDNNLKFCTLGKKFYEVFTSYVLMGTDITDPLEEVPITMAVSDMTH